MAEAEILSFRGSSVLGTPALRLPAGRCMTVRDIGFLLWLVVGFYLYNGTYAQSVCHVASLVPPAVFTYNIILTSKRTVEAHRCLLFFWFLTGISAAIDPFFSDLSGYFLAKFILLSAAFYNAIKAGQKSAAKSESTVVSSVSSPVESTKCVDWPTESTQLPTRGFETDGSSLYLDNEVIMNRAERLASGRDGPICHLPVQYAATSKDLTLQEETPRLALFASRSPPDTITRRGRAACFRGLTEEEETAASPSTQTVALGFGHLTTSPVREVVFKTANDKPHVHVTNITNENIMFGLKTNAIGAIDAFPICGVIPPGHTATIRLSMKESVDLFGRHGDKLGVDYALVGSMTSFDRLFFESSDRLRHLMAIRYY